MIIQLSLICLVANQAVFSLGEDSIPITNIPDLGLIRGKIGKTYFTGRTVYEFYGINYAKPPSKERRFKPPEKVTHWSGVYDATKMRQRCPQVDMDYYPSPPPDWLEVKEDIEDCLVLNVFTPNLNKNKKPLPVMFYIHGGSFYAGSAYEFLPGFLLEKDILLVVVQYRLGPLGFLSFKTPDVPGNMGILDIILALQWVKHNIRHFGGNAGEITVVGQSAGAAAASSLLISPLVDKDLFSKMIIQSGSVLGWWAVDEDPIATARRIAALAGCTNGTDTEITKCLMTLPPLDIVKAHMSFIVEDISLGGHGTGGSSLVVGGPSNVFVKHPKNIFMDGPNMNVPVLGGTTKDEGTDFLTGFYDMLHLNKIPDDRYFQRNITRDLLTYLGYDVIDGALIDAYQNLYFGTKGKNLKEIYPEIAAMMGVLIIKQSTYDVMRIMSRVNNAFTYSFNFYGGASKVRRAKPAWSESYPFPSGVAHSDELGYLFPMVNHTYTKRELKMASDLTTLWTNFVIYGIPADNNTGPHWPAMTSEYGPYLEISDDPQLRQNLLKEYTALARDNDKSNGSVSPCFPPPYFLFFLLIIVML